MDARQMEALENSKLTPAIGLTGGTGTGKSTVARFLEGRGALVIDADRIGHQLLADDAAVRDRLIQEFGGTVVTEDGEIDRKMLGERVFGDAIALARLNAIVHPPLLKRLRAELDSARSNPGFRLVVVDAALIVEWGIEDWFDALVVVVAPRADVERRLAAKGLDGRAVARRIQSQISEEERVRNAAVVIANDGSIDNLKRASDDLWRRFARTRTHEK